MNTSYGKLVNGAVVYAPATLHTKCGVILSPKRLSYLQAGWKRLDIQPPADPPEGKEYALTGYSETAGDIRAEWKLVDCRVPARTFSKLKVVIALTNRGKWAAIRDWLDETEYGDLFDAAQDFREDYPAFVAALSAAQERFGFTRGESAALLAECIAD